ncbi:MAG TPA: HAD family phosphatase [Methylococcaceae bacterium]|nr:HAD family phosphatase [Methylococcaceae bacterium]
MSSFDAVIFDLDGLVLDTEAGYRTAWRRAAAESGVDLDEDFFWALSGQEAGAVSQALTAVLGEDTTPERFWTRAARHWREHLDIHGIAVRPGFYELMGWLRERRIPCALATNSQRRYALECLGVAGLGDTFAHLVTRDQVERGKPAPDVYLAAAAHLGVAPARCLALEDSPTGLASARAAGMRCILVPGAPLPAEAAENAWRTFTTLLDVRDWLASLPPA